VDERRLLLELARETLRRCTAGEPPPAVDACHLPPRLNEPGACFVTLTRAGELRGCIGTLEARWPLWRAVVENTIAAALRDRRFAPVGPEELAALRLEISVLSPLRPLTWRSPAELPDLLVPGRDGVVLELGDRRATFLPQVWEKLPARVLFLEQLARKAGLPPDAWRHPDARVWVYTVEHFAEPAGAAEPGEPPPLEPDPTGD
jgi:AmmeMemoRadiSam system protein A